MQEVLVLGVIALAIFYLPRIFGKKPSLPIPARRPPVLTGRMRLAIVITILWIAGVAIFLKPWQGQPVLSLCVGLGPVAVMWGGAWVWFGYKQHRR
jgi:hypothetical protein